MNTQMHYLAKTGLMTHDQIGSLMNKHRRKELSTVDVRKEVSNSRQQPSKKTLHRFAKPSDLGNNSNNDISDASVSMTSTNILTDFRHESFLTDQQGHDLLNGLDEPAKREKYSRE